jgi:hypothetical protein
LSPRGLPACEQRSEPGALKFWRRVGALVDEGGAVDETKTTVSAGPAREAIRETVGAQQRPKARCESHLEIRAAVVGQIQREVNTMFNIEIDGLSDVQRSVSQMLSNLKYVGEVGIGKTLGDWQVENVHRLKPFVRRYRRAHRADTLFRAHSLKEVLRSRKYQRRGARKLARLVAHPSVKAAHAFSTFQAQTSTLPVLRQELIDDLTRELSEMLVEKVTWHRND